MSVHLTFIFYWNDAIVVFLFRIHIIIFLILWFKPNPMAETLPPSTLPTASISEFDAYASPAPIYTTFVQSIIDSSRVAMRELTRQSIVTWPCHKILTLSLRKALPATKIQAIDVKTVKAVINEAAAKALPLARQEEVLLACSERNDQVKKSIKDQFKAENVMPILKKQFEEFIGTVRKIIRSQLQLNQKLSAIDMDWNANSLHDIFNSNQALISACNNIRQILSLANIVAPQNPENKQAATSGQETLQFKVLLAKLSGNTKIKVDLFKLFEKKALMASAAVQKEQRWMLCCKDLQSTVCSQMDRINEQNKQYDELSSIIDGLNHQISQNLQRMKSIQDQMTQLQQELAEVKQPVAQAQTYYMNPMYERTQFEEKILMEMIEFQSDLLLGKEQIQLMTDAIVELIKLSSFSLEDLQAPKYFQSTFHRSANRIIKDIKSFENMDLEQLLPLKDDTHSLYSQFGLQQTRKSQISTRSEIQADSKLSRITEDDSLLAIQGQ